MNLNDRVGRLDIHDIALTKFAVVAGTLFIVTMWESVMDLVTSVNPWFYLGAYVLFAAKPMYDFFKKEDVTAPLPEQVEEPEPAAKPAKK